MGIRWKKSLPKKKNRTLPQRFVKVEVPFPWRRSTKEVRHKMGVNSEAKEDIGRKAYQKGLVE